MISCPSDNTLYLEPRHEKRDGGRPESDDHAIRHRRVTLARCPGQQRLRPRTESRPEPPACTSHEAPPNLCRSRTLSRCGRETGRKKNKGHGHVLRHRSAARSAERRPADPDLCAGRWAARGTAKIRRTHSSAACESWRQVGGGQGMTFAWPRGAPWCPVAPRAEPHNSAPSPSTTCLRPSSCGCHRYTRTAEPPWFSAPAGCPVHRHGRTRWM